MDLVIIRKVVITVVRIRINHLSMRLIIRENPCLKVNTLPPSAVRRTISLVAWIC